MDLQLRLSALRRRLSAEAGSLTVEAALGIAAILSVTTLLLSGSSVAIAAIKLRAISYEAVEMASASGSTWENENAARSWVKTQLPQAELQVRYESEEVQVELKQELHLLAGAWRPVVKAEASAPLIDVIAWAVP